MRTFGEYTIVDSGDSNSYSALIGSFLDRQTDSFRRGLRAFHEGRDERAVPAYKSADYNSVSSDAVQYDFLRRVPDYVLEAGVIDKTGAVISGPNNTELERAVARSAEAHISNKAPLLARYMLGFQLLKKSADETKACGIFAYRVGDELVYIPVFYLNGELLGHELMYLVSRDQFVPSDEKWVNFLLSRKPHEPGKVELRDRADIPQTSSYNPNVMTSGLKLSSVSDDIPRLHPFYVKDALRRMFKEASIRRQPERTLAELLVFDKAWKTAAQDMGLADLFSQSAKAVKLASAWSDTYPVYGRLLNQLLGVSGVISYAREWEKRASVAKQLGVRASRPESVSGFLNKQIKRASIKPAVVDNGSVSVYRMDQIPEHQYRFMPEATLSQIYKYGYYVADTRRNIKYAAVVKADSNVLRNPTEPGLYSVFMLDGTFVPCYVFRRVVFTSFDDEGDRELQWCLFCAKTRKLMEVDISQVWTQDLVPEKDWFSKLEAIATDGNKSDKRDGDRDANEGDWDANSMLITRTGACACKVMAARGDNYMLRANGAVIHLFCTGKSNGGFNELTAPTRPSTSYQGLVRVFTAPKDMLRVRNVDRCYSDSRGGSCELGTRMQWFEMLRTGTVPVRAAKLDGNRYAIDSYPAREKEAALEILMRDHDLDQATAEMLLKEADAAYPGMINRLRVKTAATGGRVSTDPYSVEFPEKPQGSHPITGIPVEESIEVEQPIDELRPASEYDEDEFYSGVLEPDEGNVARGGTPPQPNQRDMQLAAEASSAGQKDFVSSRMLMSLLRELDNDALIYKYITVFEKACDTLGRLYMQLLWRTDAFEERFGRTQLKEFREMVVNLFQDMGDFICYLRERDVRPAPVLSLSATDIESEI
jgi:hypothetical protein